MQPRTQTGLYDKQQEHPTMNIQQMMKRLTIESFVHVVMITFALVSLGNVSSFMRAAHGTELVAWALGLALGAVLVVTAIMLTRIDRTHDGEAFWTLAVIVGVCAALSGTIQFWAYDAHLPTYQAVVFGFGLPVIGEALLAYGASIFHEAERRRRIRIATNGATEAVASTVAEALADVDVTKVRKYVEKRIDGLTRAIVDGVIDELMPAQEPQECPTGVLAAVTEIDTQNTLTDAEHVPAPSNGRSFGPQNLTEANATRTEQADARRTQLLHILTHEYSGVDADTLNKTELGARLETTRQTIGRDMAVLEQQGLLSMNGVVRVTR